MMMMMMMMMMMTMMMMIVTQPQLQGTEDRSINLAVMVKYKLPAQPPPLTASQALRAQYIRPAVGCCRLLLDLLHVLWEQDVLSVCNPVVVP